MHLGMTEPGVSLRKCEMRMVAPAFGVALLTMGCLDTGSIQEHDDWDGGYNSSSITVGSSRGTTSGSSESPSNSSHPASSTSARSSSHEASSTSARSSSSSNEAVSTSTDPSSGSSQTASTSAAPSSTSTVTGNSSSHGVVHPQCPSANAYVGGDWNGVFAASANGCMLGDPFAESLPLEDVQASKAVVTIAHGNYALPTTVGTHQMRLPICVYVAGQAAPLQLGNPGQATVTQQAEGVYLQYRQLLLDGVMDEWKATLTFTVVGNQASLGFGSLTHDDKHVRLLFDLPPYHDYRRHKVYFVCVR